MPISIADLSHIADAVADLIRAIESFAREGGSKSIGGRLQQAREAILALLSPSGDQANISRNSDILDSQLSLSEKEKLHELWVNLRPGTFWGSTLPRTPQLALAKLVPVLAVLRRAAADCDQADGGQPEGTSPRAEIKWLTVSEAAKASGCTMAQISGAVRDGQLKSNGEKGRKRRIDAADLTLWQLRRAKRGESVESDETVAKKLRRAQDDQRNYRST
jgi:hypothetical protein